MDDRIDAGEYVYPLLAIAQIGADKGRLAGKEARLLRVRAVDLRDERIDDDDMVAVREERVHHMRADETRPTGNENCLLHLRLLPYSRMSRMIVVNVPCRGMTRGAGDALWVMR
jgi:hypothetical protein